MHAHPATALALLLLSVAACASGPAPSSSVAASGGSAELTIYGAASLKGALDAVKAAYEKAAPGMTLTVTTGSSSTLRAQIEQGAPADLFLSADTTNPQALAAAGLTDGVPVAFASNALVIIVPTGDPAGVGTPAGLARPGVKIVAAGTAVPITKYASQVVDLLAGQAGYPSDFAARYGANVVSREDDVKAVVAKIELGEGDAAIVYRTDAEASSKVTVIELPVAANVVATYAGVVVAASRNALAAHAFLAWLAGPDGRAILASFGFSAAP
jgi:molybdate transport system substrate-binding protein